MFFSCYFTSWILPHALILSLARITRAPLPLIINRLQMWFSPVDVVHEIYRNRDQGSQLQSAPNKSHMDEKHPAHGIGTDV